MVPTILLCLPFFRKRYQRASQMAAGKIGVERSIYEAIDA